VKLLIRLGFDHVEHRPPATGVANPRQDNSAGG
jgi:hypothetical protein